MRKVLNKYSLIIISFIIIIFFVQSDSSMWSKAKDLTYLTAKKILNYGLSMHEAMWYKKIVDGSVQCELCPFRCIIEPGERGICGVRANISGKLRALTYGKPVAIHIDPIEKKPLFHFLPTSNSYSIATVGCNLACNFCQNWTISQTAPEDTKPYSLTPREIVNQAIMKGCSSISYTYSEPIIFYEYMYDISVLAHKAGLKNVFVTCGYINEKPLRQLAKVLDAANVDLKGPESFYREFTKSSRKPVLRTLKILQEEGVWIEITNLIIPNANDDPEDIRKMCIWIAESLGVDVPLHFSRFHPNFKLTDRPPTPRKTLEMAREIALDVGLLYVYIGNVPGTEGEDTYCPITGEKVIDRMGFWVTDYKLDSNGRTPAGAIIPGVWKR